MDKISRANNLQKQAVDLLNPASSTSASNQDVDQKGKETHVGIQVQGTEGTF